MRVVMGFGFIAKVVGGVVAAAVLIALPLLFSSSYYTHILILSGIYVLLASGLNLTMGYTGQVSLAHAAFFGIGAYVTGLMATQMGSPFWLDMPVAGIAAGIAGLIIGLPTARLRGFYLVMATLGFVSIVNVVFGNWEEVTRGHMGIRGIPAPDVPFVGPLGDKVQFYWLILVLSILTVWIIQRIVRSYTGRALIAIRDDEIAARAAGINVLYYKVLAFALGAFFAGIAGSFYARYITYISPDSFTIFESVFALAMVIAGGSGSLVGPIVGAVALTVLPEGLRAIGDFRMAIFGLLLLVGILFLPRGIYGSLSDVAIAKLKRRGVRTTTGRLPAK